MTQLRFLSLDDDEKFNNLISVKLKKNNIDIVTTSKVKDFLNLVQKKSWDCYLIDLNLQEGEGSGFALIKLLRDKLKILTPIIILSRNDEYDKIAHALDCGASDYITKPLDMDMLITKIAYIDEANTFDHVSLAMNKVPIDLQECFMISEFELESINEQGLLLVSKNRISKGNMVQLSGPIIQEIFNTPKLNIMVTKTSKISEKAYTTFVQFDEDDITNIKKVKNWIKNKQYEI